jgi:hypothetical protein
MKKTIVTGESSFNVRYNFYLGSRSLCAFVSSHLTYHTDCCCLRIGKQDSLSEAKGPKLAVPHPVLEMEMAFQNDAM